MSLILLLARLLLVGVFIVSGLAKLADLKGSREALRDFGLPVVLARPFSILLPLAELAVAVMLLPSVSAWWGAIGALALLALFIVGIAYNLARGRKPECHCFGQLSSKPIGWSTLIRNLLLAVVAAFIVGFGWSNAGLNLFDWLGVLTATQRIELVVGLILVVLVMLEGWVLVHVLRQQGRLLLRLEGIEAQLAATGLVPQADPTGNVATPVTGPSTGTLAPGFTLSALTGETITLKALRALGKPVVLLFSDPGCGPCTALLPEIGRWQREHTAKLVVVLVSRGTVEANYPKATEHGLTHVLLQQDREVAQVYQAYGTPSAVLVRRDGTIGSPLAQGADAIRTLIDQTLNPSVLGTLPMVAAPNGNGQRSMAASQPPAGPKRGESAPEFRLPDLSNNMVSLSDFRGSPTLLLFCQRMLADLQTWEAHPPEGAPRLVVVSTDSVEDNRAMGLRSPVLLDKDGMRVGGLFGATGTPMAVLVDTEGNIASELAAGAPAVLTLAGQEQDKATPA